MKTVTLGALRRMNPIPSLMYSSEKYQYYWCPATNSPRDVAGMVNGKTVKIKRNYVEQVLNNE